MRAAPRRAAPRCAAAGGVAHVRSRPLDSFAALSMLTRFATLLPFPILPPPCARRRSLALVRWTLDELDGAVAADAAAAAGEGASADAGASEGADGGDAVDKAGATPAPAPAATPSARAQRAAARRAARRRLATACRAEAARLDSLAHALGAEKTLLALAGAAVR